MPTLHIEFDATGGTLFEIRYREVGSSAPFQTIQVNSSPADITVPTANPYEYCIKKICEPGNDSIEICGTASYIPPCATPQFSFNSRTGNNVTFNYILQSNQVQFDLEVTAPAGGIPTVSRYQTNQNPSPFTISLTNIVTGTYRFRMRGVCGPSINSAVSPWTDFVDVAVVVSPCIKPSDIIPIANDAPPEVFLKWNNNLGQEDRNCLQTQCSYTILIEATDVNNDLSILKVYKSTDSGATWVQLFTTPTGTTFGDNITTGINMYKVEAVDLAGNTSDSNILQIAKRFPVMTYYFRGIFSASDPIHPPDFGVVTYKDGYGITQVFSGIVMEGCVTITASSITSQEYVVQLSNCL